MKKHILIGLGFIFLSFQTILTENYKLLPPAVALPPVTKAYGGKIERDESGSITRESVDIDERDASAQDTFKNLIIEKQEQGLPYILAAVTVTADTGPERRYQDAFGLNNWMLHENFSRQPKKKHPLTNQPVLSPIHYFVIDAPDGEFSYLCSENDLTQADNFFRVFMQANDGDKNAQFNLGHLYYNQGNMADAEKYYKLAADLDHIKAQNNLGLIYENQDKMDDAEKYFKLAANQEYTYAQLNLIYLYEMGKTKDLSHDQILEYYRKAQEQRAKIENYNQQHPERWAVIKEAIERSEKIKK